jgi:hypothetical protein
MIEKGVPAFGFYRHVSNDLKGAHANRPEGRADMGSGVGQP